MSKIQTKFHDQVRKSFIHYMNCLYTICIYDSFTFLNFCGFPVAIPNLQRHHGIRSLHFRAMQRLPKIQSRQNDVWLGIKCLQKPQRPRNSQRNAPNKNPTLPSPQHPTNQHDLLQPNLPKMRRIHRLPKRLHNQLRRPSENQQSLGLSQDPNNSDKIDEFIR